MRDDTSNEQHEKPEGVREQTGKYKKEAGRGEEETRKIDRETDRNRYRRMI